ncbi:Replicative DNA helicase [Rhodospirillaceae bacterium LM-1]|nr:Replicative DNA helicase [Rhodospirillaceae bacterium LM-1]
MRVENDLPHNENEGCPHVEDQNLGVDVQSFSNVEAEQALLGAIMRNHSVFESLSEFLEARCFSIKIHQEIYEGIAKLLERGLLPNMVNLKSHFESNELFAEVGAHQYLDKLFDSGGIISDAREYAKLLNDLYLRRKLIEFCNKTLREAFSVGLSVSAIELIEHAEQNIFELAAVSDDNTSQKDFNHAASMSINLAEAAYRRGGKPSGVSTGFVELDCKLGGLHPSELVVLAGRPGMGRTAIATNIAFNAANAYSERADESGRKIVTDGAVVAFFSLKMRAENLAARILSERTGIPFDKIHKGQLHSDDFISLIQAGQDLQKLKLIIDDSPALTVSSLRTKARRLARIHGLGLIVIDDLQSLRASALSRMEKRSQEIGAITKDLKALAMELNVPVLALSQLSRAVEQRENKHPQLADFSESGSIEQDADVVLFVFREQNYWQQLEPTRRRNEPEGKFWDRHKCYMKRLEEVWNSAEIIIAKNGNGPTGAVRLFFDFNTLKFSDFTES